MEGYFALVLHCHLPFVRHPEHDRFLEENWLYEAIAETYIPLIDMIDRWLDEKIDARITISLTPPLCSMLLDEFLQKRFVRYLEGLIELAEKETHRTYWDKPFHPLAQMYLDRFKAVQKTWEKYNGNLIQAFCKFQEEGKLEIITSA